MREGARTALTVSVLVAILLLGAVWGWTALTQPFPGKAEVSTCVARTVGAGDKVYPDQVVVSVFNAGSREGLAGRTMQLFTDEGFKEGDRGNADPGTKVARAQIWAADPHSPAVRLVASRLGHGTRVVRRDGTGAGVVVVVGDRFTKLVPGLKAVKVAEDTEICTAPSE